MVNTYWANFAKTGDPNGKGLPEWPVYDPQRTRSSSSDPMDRRSVLPIPRKLVWMLPSRPPKQRSDASLHFHRTSPS